MSEPSVTGGQVPASLLEADLAPLWQLVATRLEQRGEDWRGSARRPRLSSRGVQLLGSLLGRRPGSMIDLGELEAALVARGAGDDLAGALERLGHPVSTEPARRRAERARAAAAKRAARDVAEGWPEAWATDWVDEIVAAGVLRRLEPDEAAALVHDVRRVLDELNALATGDPISRTDLAATVLGSSHALDTGSRREVAVTRALARRHGSGDARALWESAGAHTDLVSAPALCWALPVLSHSPVSSMATSATDAGLPLHLSQMALRAHPVQVRRATRILVVENPRVVEAAAQRRTPLPLVCTNGNPSHTVTLLIDQLLACSAELHYHGDFDAAGLAIAQRMQARGVVPWRMTAEDYLAAVQAAERQGVELPLDERAAPDTPWDPRLSECFEQRRLVVHQERLLDELLDPLSPT